MNALRRTNRIVRTTALLSLGALALHQLRYILAYGRHADTALAHQGHGYLSDLGGALVGLSLAALLATLFGGRLAPARKTSAPFRSVMGRASCLYALALLTIFASQELAEGALAAGHPAGLAAVFARGGWMALPLAAAIGALCALASLTLRGVEQALARRAIGPRFPRPPLAIAAPGAAPAWLPLAALNLGFGFARRPPPPLPPAG